MTENRRRLPHLLVTGTARIEQYVKPPSGGGGDFALPPRNRRRHGRKLLAQLEELRSEAETLAAKQRAFGVDAGNGIVIQFESEPAHELAIKSLEFSPAGIELLAVRQLENRVVASVFVPEGKLDRFINLVTSYLNKETPTGLPKNQRLVDSISEISKAVLDA